MDDKTQHLTVISGGKDKAKPNRRTGKAATPTGLTGKQEAFARHLALDGMTNSEAYRLAYQAEGMAAATVHSEACKQAQHPKVSQRVHELLAEKRAKHNVLTEKQTDRVWRGVWRLAEGDGVPPAVQQSALALAAKMAGMLTDRVETRIETADSKSIEAELLQRLQRLTG